VFALARVGSLSIQQPPILAGLERLREGRRLTIK
jgi:hypothetical protein